MTGALIAGLGLGFLVAAQVGPIWLLCARSVARGRIAVGLAIGAGAALIDVAYAALGIAGAAGLMQIPALRLTMGLIGAAVLLFIGFRTLRSAFRIRTGLEQTGQVGNVRRAFWTALWATASNPLTIVSWGAVFAAASTARVADTPLTAGMMLLGIGAGTLAWFSLLSVGMGLLRRVLGARALQAIDIASGLGLVLFGGLLGWQTVHQVS